MARTVSESKSPQDWKILFQQWRESGDTESAFCRAHGIKVSTFCSARKRLGSKKSRKVAIPPAAFAPVRIVHAPAPAQSSALELVLRGGRVLKVSGDILPQRLAELAQALEAR